MRYAFLILLLLTGLSAPSSKPSPTAESLLSDLASPDPKTRTAASNQLLILGLSARPVVLAALRSPNPEIRARASDLILKLPWTTPADPGEVQRVLTEYGQHDPANRIHDVTMLAKFSDRAGLPAVVRLLTEDPSDSVRWAIVAVLHETDPLPPAIASLRALDPADQSSPVLAGIALAFSTTDRDKSQHLYQQASEVLLRDNAPAELHLAFGDLLADQGLRALGRHEYETSLSTPGQHLPLPTALAHFQLATLIGDSNDRAAADHLKAGIDAYSQSEGAGLTVNRDNIRLNNNDALDDLRAVMHFHYYRAAIADHDPILANQHLAKLLALNPSRSEVVLEVVPALKQLHRTAEAQTMFNRAYQSVKALTEADPTNAQNFNELAWLCARCDEHPDEAIALSLKALQLSPNNPAYMDTAAEAYFHAGHPDQAVSYESHALKLHPGDEFMQAQLKRFQQHPPSTQP
ncbi:MAG TPA: hypothetical protein VFE58_13145 [Tepidisphaeraceae bacterium]|nr:hypothetical protein [Tepidisphaeraceae bacterium]